MTSRFSTDPLESRGIGQIYYFKRQGQKLEFEVLADWKAWREIDLSVSESGNIVGRGWINQKSHVTPLSCRVQLK